VFLVVDLLEFPALPFPVAFGFPPALRVSLAPNPVFVPGRKFGFLETTFFPAGGGLDCVFCTGSGF